jgi:hypothetical protein
MAIRGTANMPATDELVGRPVYDADDQKIGDVEGLYVDNHEGAARYLAVQSGWFGPNRHVIPIDEATARGSDPDKEILVPYTRDELSGAPTFEDGHELTLRDERRLQEYYGVESYQEVLDARQTSPAPTPEVAEAELEAAINRGEDPRSVRTRRWGV